MRCEPYPRAVTDILHIAIDREEMCRFCQGAIFTECEIARCLVEIPFYGVNGHRLVKFDMEVNYMHIYTLYEI